MTAGDNHCVDEVNHSNVTVSEKGRKANFRNSKRESYRKIRVDGCLVNEGKRADWIVSKVGYASVIVELKGKDLDHGCKQLQESAKCDICAPWLEEKKALLLVCSRVPSFDSTIAKAKEDARKKGMKLLVVCNQSDLRIEDIF